MTRWRTYKEAVAMHGESVDNRINAAVTGNVVQARDIGVVNIGGDTGGFDLDEYLRAVLRAAVDQPVASRTALSETSVTLGEVYVDQDLDHQSNGQPGTWREALAAHRNLILVGAPGGGKSSMLRRIAHTLADEHLLGDEPDCLPVRVHARAFRQGAPLAEAIREGVVAGLGPFLLRTLPHGVFAESAPGGRPWLVLVDGLDEVSGLNEFQTALQAVTEAARHPFLRFVVATRPLQESDLDAARNRFPVCRLRPFDLPTLRRFASRWFERHRRPNAGALSDRLVDHVRHREIKDWAVQPLAATMLCELLTRDPERGLPERVIDLYEQYVNKLFTWRSHTNEQRTANRDVIKLLERVAAERKFRNSGISVLDAAAERVKDTALQPQSADPAVRYRELHDLLCRTGMVVSVAGGVEFAHATLEEYFAARMVGSRLSESSAAEQQTMIDQVVAALSRHDSGEASEFYRSSQLPVFLLNLWAVRGRDADALLARLVRTSPDQSWQLVRRLGKAGTSIGPKATAALAAVSGGVVKNHRDRLDIARTLLALDHPEGLDRLLAMTVDASLPDASRITAVREASRSSPAAATAVSFLLRRDDFPDWNSPRDVVDVFDAVDDESSEGLELVLRNKRLPDGMRVHAAALTIGEQGEPAYLRLLEQRFTFSLTAMLGGEAARGVMEAWPVLWRMVADSELAFDHRFKAAEELNLLNGDSGAFRALAEDPAVDEDHRWLAVEAMDDPFD